MQVTAAALHNKAEQKVQSSHAGIQEQERIY
jgi:hypothetical protein